MAVPDAVIAQYLKWLKEEDAKRVPAADTCTDQDRQDATYVLKQLVLYPPPSSWEQYAARTKGRMQGVFEQDVDFLARILAKARGR